MMGMHSYSILLVGLPSRVDAEGKGYSDATWSALGVLSSGPCTGSGGPPTLRAQTTETT